MSIKEGIKKQRRLIALLHDAQSPEHDAEGNYVYNTPQSVADDILAKYNKLTEELWNMWLTAPNKPL